MVTGETNISDSRKEANKLINAPLTSEQFDILTKVAYDPFFFSTFIYVINAVQGKVRFDLYPYQKSVLWSFIHRRFNIILKFRQAGITELISLFCLWYAMFHPNKNINIISIKDTVAKKVLRKIKFMYRNLPEFLKVQIINGRTKDLGTASEMEFANGSIITSIPTTEEAGRSESLSLLVIDEAAIIRWADQIWAAAFPTLSTGGRAILNSTQYGIGNFFHKKWVEACSGGNEFTPIRLKWRMHPDRDIEWYKQMSTALGPRRTAQEIDGDFLTSGASVFDLMDIRAIEENLDQYIPLNLRKDPLFSKLFKGDIRQLSDFLQIFDKPKKNKKYTIGSDIATGRSRDYSAFTIMDQEGEEAGSFKMKLPVNELSLLLARLGNIYNRATLAPESNDIGLAVSSKLQEDGYSNLHYSVKLIKQKREKRPKEEKIPGWYTTSKNRPIIINELEEDIRLGNINIKDEAFVQEAYTFIYDDKNKPIAMGKGSGSSDSLADDDDAYVDDAILGKAITNHVRKIKQRGLIVLPQ
jgi:hypothetical protein